MATIQTVRAVPVLVLGVVLITMPAWAKRDDVPPIQSLQPVVVYEGPSHGTESIHTYRGGLSADSLKTGDLNLGSVGGGVDGSRTTSWPSYFNVRPGEISHHDVGDGGIPLWRW